MSPYDDEVVAQADAVVRAAIDAVLAARPREAVVVTAPAGAGKSYAIVSGVAAARSKGLRVAVGTPTNEQAHDLVRALAKRLAPERIAFLHAKHRPFPDDQPPKNARPTHDAHEASVEAIVVGTLSKLADAHARGDLARVDLLFVDEAYQANAVQYYGVGDLAPRHLLMGDSGQLAPFSAAPDADRWRGLATDPLLTAVEVLRRHHPSTREFKLPITRRLDPRALPVVQAFYPGHPFKAAVKHGVRRMALGKPTATRGMAAFDAVLDHAAEHGWAHAELPAGVVLAADPETIAAIVRLLKRLVERGAFVRSERRATKAALLASDIAVAVSHRDQRSLLREALDAVDLQDVVVDTANKLQGRTFEVLVAWHPLAGLDGTDEFHVDHGRLCVMLTRHRHACIVVGRASDRELVQGIPPASPSYAGYDANPAMDGWYVHEAVFAALADHRLPLPGGTGAPRRR